MHPCVVGLLAIGLGWCCEVRRKHIAKECYVLVKVKELRGLSDGGLSVCHHIVQLLLVFLAEVFMMTLTWAVCGLFSNRAVGLLPGWHCDGDSVGRF